MKTTNNMTLCTSMHVYRRRASGIACLLVSAPLLLVACRADPGNSDYEGQESFASQEGDAGSSPTNVLPGPDPWEPGETRLSIGAFYEGGSSDLIAIDEIQTHLYIYENTVRSAPIRERIEGLEATGIEHTGGNWWGMGVHWDSERDLSAWSTLHVSLASEYESFGEIEIGMNDPNGTYTVQASDYGYVADGTWHNLAIPLADLDAAGLTRSQVIAVLVLLGGAGENGDRAAIDNVYITAE